MKRASASAREEDTPGVSPGRFIQMEINLVLQKQGIKKEIRRFLLISFGIFSFTVILTIVSFVINLYLISQLSTKQNTKNQIIADIDREEEKAGKIIALNERMTSIKSVVGTKKDITIPFLWVLTQIPESLTFNTIDVTTADINLGIQTADLGSINTAMDRLYNLDKSTSLVKKADLVSFVKTEDNQYNLQLKFEVLNKSK